MVRVLWRIPLVLLLAFVVSGCLSGPKQGDEDDSAVDPRWAGDAWRAALTTPVYDGVDSSLHYITAEDGARLSLTVHLPRDLPDGQRIPTLMQLTPYQAGSTPMHTPATGFMESDTWPGNSWRFIVERGAAYVEADARGTNGSEGCLDFGGSLDRSDARIFMEWIRSQSWSDGRIVTDGVSHPGMGSVVAHAADPALTAALTHAPVVSYYQDEWLQGAKFEDQLNLIYQVIELGPAYYLDPEGLASQAAPCTGQTTAQYGAVDGQFTELWADRDLSRHIHPDVRTPILFTHGFLDQNVHPDHTQLYWDALPDDFPKHAIFGWWYHSWPNMEGHPAATRAEGLHTFFELRHRWLDATLFGIDNGLWHEARVLVQDSRLDWHESHGWPIDKSEAVTLHAVQEGTLGATAATGTTSYMDNPGAVRGEWQDAHVAFRSAPLESAMLINGAPVVDLVASSSESETKWVAYLLDEAPDGTWSRITHGYADSRTHAGESGWDPITPGTAYPWQLRLLPTAVVVEQGHRVTLVITSQDSRNVGADPGGRVCWDTPRGTCYAPSGILPASTVGRAENTVHLGPDGTRVTFHWIDPEVTAKPTRE
jgi:X-Pro dipeptidyl-peptidase